MKLVIIILIIGSILVVLLSLLFRWYMDHFFKKLKLLYKEAILKEIIVEKDLIYKENEKNKLKMDLYRPGGKNKDEKVPVIILLHGEGIEKLLKDVKEWSFYTSYGRVIADKGYAAVTFHRSRTNLNFNHKEVAQDIIDAVAYVRNNAEQWSLDADRIGIWSFSLGGLYLSLFLKETPEYIRCLISYYGLLDIKSKVKKLDSVSKNYEPENYLPEQAEGFPPLLVVKAERDKVKGVIESQEHFMEVANNKKLPFEVLLHHTGGHTFDALNDNEETQEIMNKTWDFIRKNL